jgi:hypothetical protein
MLERLYKVAQIIAALATAVLAFLTFSVVRLNSRYVALTNQLVLQQQTPDVEVEFLAANGQPVGIVDELVVQNSGPRAVVNVEIWWTSYLHDAKGKLL